MDEEKHGAYCEDEHGKRLFSLRLPLFFETPKEREPLWAYVERLPTYCDIPSWNLLLMEAGRAALGFVEDTKIQKHKNIRKYMVRKKQGKAQLTHLKTKGKSRYGSRLRLKEAEAYFDEILERLDDDVHSQAKFVFYHCPVRLKACLSDAGEQMNFDFSKFTWKRLAVNVRESSFDELKRLSREPLFCRFTLEDENLLEQLPAIPEYRV
ncbi:MAG: hypothetical protein HRT88_13155 [Lentisphaeraceae bacterium]|nr:hypothetical protein [Lentisphaeraceae bacterium]